jgi:hypothetical protein
MEERAFHIPDHGVEARLARLGEDQAEALGSALDRLSNGKGKRAPEGGADGGGADAWPLFLLPLAESGLTADQMVRLAEKVPDGFPLDHRDIYFDFRLGRWIKHIEPPTISQCLEEYLENAESPGQGLAYLRNEWAAFLRRHGAG